MFPGIKQFSAKATALGTALGIVASLIASTAIPVTPAHARDIHTKGPDSVRKYREGNRERPNQSGRIKRDKNFKHDEENYREHKGKRKQRSDSEEREQEHSHRHDRLHHHERYHRDIDDRRRKHRHTHKHKSDRRHDDRQGFRHDDRNDHRNHDKRSKNNTGKYIAAGVIGLTIGALINQSLNNRRRTEIAYNAPNRPMVLGSPHVLTLEDAMRD